MKRKEIRFRLIWIFIFVAVCSVFAWAYAARESEYFQVKNSRLEDAFERLKDAVSRYEKLYGEIPIFGDIDGMRLHLISNRSMDENSADSIIRYLSKSNRGEYLSFWLMDQPSRHQNIDPKIEYLFSSDVWTDDDNDGLFELDETKVPKNFWERLKNVKAEPVGVEDK